MSKFDVPSFSVTGYIYRERETERERERERERNFQTSHFADFELFKVDIYFANFAQVKIDPTWSFLLTLDKPQLFY